MSCTVRMGRQGGFDAVVLSNGRLRATVLPQLGARVWQLEDVVRRREWIWHRPGVPLASWPRGTAYDDVWAGGWEELFPNDAPAELAGRQLHDHGEWWTADWLVSEIIEGPEARVRLESREPIAGTRCVKELSLDGDDARLRVSYEISNLSPEGFHFLFKQHLPVAITASCRIALPGGRVSCVDQLFGSSIRSADEFEWPYADGTDLRVIPGPESSAREFVYVQGLPEGWCAVVDTSSGSAIRLSFDATAMPFVWLFLTYGGWRQCYTAVLEPCTNMPKDLAEAARRGQSAYLPPHGCFATSVTVEVGAVPPLAIR